MRALGAARLVRIWADEPSSAKSRVPRQSNSLRAMGRPVRTCSQLYIRRRKARRICYANFRDRTLEGVRHMMSTRLVISCTDAAGAQFFGDGDGGFRRDVWGGADPASKWIHRSLDGRDQQLRSGGWVGKRWGSYSGVCRKPVRKRSDSASLRLDRFAGIWDKRIRPGGGSVSRTGLMAGGAAFIGTPAGSAVIPSPGGQIIVFGTAVNDSGQVAGDTLTGAFIGSLSGSAFIPRPPGYGAGSLVNGIRVNNLGHVSGTIVMTSGQAFIGTVAGSTVIPLPAGWGAAGSGSINDSDQVVGNRNPPGQAFIGTTAGSTAIPLPSGATTALLGIAK